IDRARRCLGKRCAWEDRTRADRDRHSGAMEEPAAGWGERKHALLAVTFLSGSNLARLRFGDRFAASAQGLGDRLCSRADTFGIHGTPRHGYTSLLPKGSVCPRMRLSSIRDNADGLCASGVDRLAGILESHRRRRRVLRFARLAFTETAEPE